MEGRGEAAGLPHEVGEAVAVEIRCAVFPGRYKAGIRGGEASVGVTRDVPVPVLHDQELRATVAGEAAWDDRVCRARHQAGVERCGEARWCSEQNAPAQPAAAGIDRIEQVRDAVAVQFEGHGRPGGRDGHPGIDHGLPAARAVLVSDRGGLQARGGRTLLHARQSQPSRNRGGLVAKRVRLDRRRCAHGLDRDPVELIRIAHQVAGEVARGDVARRANGISEVDAIERPGAGGRGRVGNRSDSMRAVRVCAVLRFVGVSQGDGIARAGACTVADTRQRPGTDRGRRAGVCA